MYVHVHIMMTIESIRQDLLTLTPINYWLQDIIQVNGKSI